DRRGVPAPWHRARLPGARPGPAPRARAGRGGLVRLAGTANLFSARRPPPGARPGEFVVPADAHPTRVRAVVWDDERVEVHDVRSAADLAAVTSRPGLAWIEV